MQMGVCVCCCFGGTLLGWFTRSTKGNGKQAISRVPILRHAQMNVSSKCVFSVHKKIGLLYLPPHAPASKERRVMFNGMGVSLPRDPFWGWFGGNQEESSLKGGLNFEEHPYLVAVFWKPPLFCHVSWDPNGRRIAVMSRCPLGAVAGSQAVVQNKFRCRFWREAA